MSHVQFIDELTKLINKHGIDSYVGVADYLLAELINHLLSDLAYIESRKKLTIKADGEEGTNVMLRERRK